MTVALLLGLLGGICIGMFFGLLVSVFMFTKYKRENDVAEEQRVLTYKLKLGRIRDRVALVAGLIFNYATGYIPDIVYAVTKRHTFPYRELNILGMLLSWIHMLEWVKVECSYDEDEVSLISHYEDRMRERIEDFIIVVDPGPGIAPRNIIISWNGLAEPFSWPHKTS